MSLSLYAKVTGNQPVGPEIYLLTLEAPALAEAARPGQFVMLRVGPGPDPLLARPFSIHGVEGGKLLILYQVKGKGTKLLAGIRPGTELLVWGPLGRGFELNVERPVLVAGGMGVAPVAFAARFLEDQGVLYHLLTGGQNEENVNDLINYFKKSLKKLLEQGRVERFREFLKMKEETALSSKSFRTSGTATSSTIEQSSNYETGFVTNLLDDITSKLSGRYGPDSVIACGPLPMLKAVAIICARRNLPCQVSLEAPMACGVGACLGCAIPAAGGGYLRACQEGPVMEASLVDWERV
jgi:dihydroorotate dehydrogenase electron transfer subunit